MVRFSIFFFLLFLNMQAQYTDFDVYLKELSTEFDVPQIFPDSLEKIQAMIFDTREVEEFKISHIERAQLLEYDNFAVEKLDTIDKDTTIIVYCSVGYRSSIIARKLIEEGFKDVRNLYGGIFQWVNQGRNIVNNSGATDSLHTYNEYWGQFIYNPKITKVSDN